MDTIKSKKILQKFMQHEPKYKRKMQEFSGTFDTTPDVIFPLLCPTREADWIPGWDCELIYTDSGYAEDKCVFRTDKSNSVGEGLWAFTGYKLNEYIKFIIFQQDILMHVKISLTQNEDGTTTTTWNMTFTALNEKGNKKIDDLHSGFEKTSPAVKMIEHYLKKGKAISKVSLAIKMKHH